MTQCISDIYQREIDRHYEQNEADEINAWFAHSVDCNDDVAFVGWILALLRLADLHGDEPDIPF